MLLDDNTPRHSPKYPKTDRLADFQHQLSLQAAAAKAGVEERVEQIGGSMILAPSGEVVARAATLGNEIIVHRCDLDLCCTYKEGVFPASRALRTADTEITFLCRRLVTLARQFGQTRTSKSLRPPKANPEQTFVGAGLNSITLRQR